MPGGREAYETVDGVFGDTLKPVPLFRHSKDDPAPGAPSAPGTSAGPDQLESALEHLEGLSLPLRAAEVLAQVAPAIEQSPFYLGMDKLLAPWLPSDWNRLSDQQRTSANSLELVLQEAFQALVLARMLIRREENVPQEIATMVRYANSADGRAALDRGDVAEVVARRLPD